MRCSQHPLSANERCTTQILIERIDERHLPAPLAIFAILAANHARTTSSAVVGRQLSGTRVAAVLIVFRIDNRRRRRQLWLIVIGAQLIALNSAAAHQVAQLVIVNLNGHNGGAEHEAFVGLVNGSTAASIGCRQLSGRALYAVLGPRIGDIVESGRAAGATRTQGALDATHVLGVDVRTWRGCRGGRCCCRWCGWSRWRQCGLRPRCGSIIIRIAGRWRQSRLIDMRVVRRWWWTLRLVGHVVGGCVRRRWWLLHRWLWSIRRRIVEVGGVIACLELLLLQDFALGRATDLTGALASKQICHLGVFWRRLAESEKGNSLYSSCNYLLKQVKLSRLTMQEPGHSSRGSGLGVWGNT